MELVALVRPSQGFHPGHMVIGQESDDGSARYFGFRFSPTSLPPEFQTEERWQEYLNSHTVPGNIHDERKHVRDLRQETNTLLYEKRGPCDTPIDAQIPPRRNWRHFAQYSFRPDDFHSDAEPCYNCVTWAIMIGNRMVADFLTPVQQGRIKLMIKQFRESYEQAGGTNG